MQKQTGAFQKPIKVFTHVPFPSNKGPIPPVSTQHPASDPQSPGVADGLGHEEMDLDVPERPVGFPPAGMQAPQASLQLRLLNLPKPNDEPSVQAVVKELLSESGQEQVRQTLSSQATPQVKALVLEMLAKALGSAHCTTRQLGELIAAYAPMVPLSMLFAPIWAPPSPQERPVSGIDRAWALAERLAGAPEQLDALRSLANDRWSDPCAWQGWKVVLDLAQFVKDSPDECQYGQDHAIRQFLDKSARANLTTGSTEQRVFFDNLWLSAVVNGLSNKFLDNVFMFSYEAPGNKVSGFLLDRARHPLLLNRLSPSLCQGMDPLQQLALLEQNLTRMAVRTPRLLSLLAPQPSDSWTGDDVARATASVDSALLLWKEWGSFAQPQLDLSMAGVAPDFLAFGNFWNGLAKQHPDWWAGVLSRHPWMAQIIQIVESNDLNNANDAGNRFANNDAAGSAIVRVIHQNLYS